MPILRESMRVPPETRSSGLTRRHTVPKSSRKTSVRPMHSGHPYRHQHPVPVSHPSPRLVYAPQWNPDALPQHPTPAELHQSRRFQIIQPRHEVVNTHTRIQKTTQRQCPQSHGPPPPYSIMDPALPPKTRDGQKKRSLTLRITFGRSARK